MALNLSGRTAEDASATCSPARNWANSATITRILLPFLEHPQREKLRKALDIMQPDLASGASNLMTLNIRDFVTGRPVIGVPRGEFAQRPPRS